MAEPRNLLFNSCSVLMAALFALSTLAQFDDPDWYFWIPLYAAACVVNLVNGMSKYKKMRRIARFAQWLGFFLLTIAIIEGYVQRIAGFWSLAMREKLLGEKIGSAIVISSMFLQLQESSGSNKAKIGKGVEYGMALLVGLGYGRSLVFVMFYKGDMKS